MTTPNLPGAIRLHAAGDVSGAGALGPNASNTSGVVRNAVGDYTVTLGTQIDPTDRIIKAQAKGAIAAVPTIDAETDSTFQVFMFDNAGAALDADFSFEVTRHAIG